MSWTVIVKKNDLSLGTDGPVYSTVVESEKYFLQKGAALLYAVGAWHATGVEPIIKRSFPRRSPGSWQLRRKLRTLYALKLASESNDPAMKHSLLSAIAYLM